MNPKSQKEPSSPSVILVTRKSNEKKKNRPRSVDKFNTDSDQPILIFAIYCL